MLQRTTASGIHTVSPSCDWYAAALRARIAGTVTVGIIEVRAAGSIIVVIIYSLIRLVRGALEPARYDWSQLVLIYSLSYANVRVASPAK